MRKPYQLPGWTKSSSYYSAPVGDRTHDHSSGYIQSGPFPSVTTLFAGLTCFPHQDFHDGRHGLVAELIVPQNESGKTNVGLLLR